MQFTVHNPKHLVLIAAVVLAKAMHTGPRCHLCAGRGMLWNMERDQRETCPKCDGFGRRLRST